MTFIFGLFSFLYFLFFKYQWIDTRVDTMTVTVVIMTDQDRMHIDPMRITVQKETIETLVDVVIHQAHITLHLGHLVEIAIPKIIVIATQNQEDILAVIPLPTHHLPDRHQDHHEDHPMDTIILPHLIHTTLDVHHPQ